MFYEVKSINDLERWAASAVSQGEYEEVRKGGYVSAKIRRQCYIGSMQGRITLSISENGYQMFKLMFANMGDGVYRVTIPTYRHSSEPPNEKVDRPDKVSTRF